VTLSGFTGGEYLPLPASKGPAFPSPLTLDGCPTSLADYVQKQRSPPQKYLFPIKSDNYKNMQIKTQETPVITEISEKEENEI
jgi:hypothetical protein